MRRSARRQHLFPVNWALAHERSKLDEPALRVENIMSRAVYTCRSTDPLSVAAQIMWEHDCGCVPVVDAAARVISMLTDRDVSMAAYTQGRRLDEIPVASACSQSLYSCDPSELVSDAAELMARAGIRRLPVIDASEKLVGILTLSDLVLHLWFARAASSGTLGVQRVAAVLESVSRPRWEVPGGLSPMTSYEKAYLAAFDAP